MLNALDHNLTEHAPQYVALLSLLLVAAISNMPHPDEPFGWRTLYKWLYNSLQAFVGAVRPTPRPPDPPSSGPTQTR